MRRRLAARLAQSLVVVFLATTTAFVVIRLAPGDPFSYDNPLITPAVRQQWRRQFGFDRPLAEQYVRYVASMARGQLGYSFSKRESVAAALGDAIPRTLLLTGVALGLSVVLGAMVGVVQAVRRGSWFDRASSGVLLLFYSFPDFWGALMLLLLFAYWVPVLPAGGIVDPVLHDYMGFWHAAGDRLRHLLLPAASLTLLGMAGIARYQRAAMLEVLPADYVRTARAKGLPEWQVVWRHALRTALAPLIVIIGFLLPAFLGGAVFVEKVFAWPGMGLLATDAIGSRDYDLVCATVVIGAVMVVTGNLVADLLHMALDPRVRDATDRE